MLRRSGRRSIGLLLSSVLASFISPAKSTCQTAHGRAGRCSLTSIARYRTPNRSECSAPSRSLHDVRLGWPIGLRIEGVRVGRISLARIESRLLNRPAVTLITISILLLATLLLERIHVQLTLGRHSDGQNGRERKYRGRN